MVLQLHRIAQQEVLQTPHVESSLGSFSKVVNSPNDQRHLQRNSICLEASVASYVRWYRQYF